MPKADFFVGHEQFTITGTQFVAEISELGWKRWPQYVGVHGKNGMRLFGPRQPIMNGEEIGGYMYPQTDRSLAPVCEVHVLND